MEETTYAPPTVPNPPPLHTYTDYSPIPSSILNSEKPTTIVFGIDEAGRGPIIGPMVYALAYCTLEFAMEELPNLEFADSKQLTEPKRWELMKDIVEKEEIQIGYAVTSLSPNDISVSMLRSSNVINLNEQAHSATIDLIRTVMEKIRAVNPETKFDAVYIDTVGPPASYTTKLRKFFTVEQINKIVVEKKADDTYPIVSAASVVAKVTRDWSVKCSAEIIGATWGSGYPSDPKTKAYINSNIHPWYGWDENIRYSWGTAKTALENSNAINMRWEHELVKKHGFDDVVGMFNKTDNNEITKNWFVQ